jgi:succinylarginine dihydrolase
MGMTKEERIRRGVNATGLLQDEVFKDAIRVVKEYHTSKFSRPDATDAEVLEARRMVLALTELVTQIVSFIEDGKIAKTAEEKERHRG